MAFKISLCLWFSYITVLHLISTLAQSYDNYIIHMDLSAMPKVFSSQRSWYLSTLSSALDGSQDTTNNLNHASSKLIYTYTNAMNGFSASLSPTELEAMKRSPGYISSTQDFPVKLHTTHSPQFLGLNPHKGAWPAAEFGKDVIIGLVDTGVWPESEIFRDDGMTEIPSRWRGQCENSIQFNSSLCNKKLIGARFFNKGFLAAYPNITIADNNSTRDRNGHGTHTSSIAAGSRVEGASYFGYAAGSATGIASWAKIAMYKAIWDIGAVSSDIIAAIDCAISDGVDVLSLSIGMQNPTLYKDPIAIATFAAVEKGIFVSASAGNNGPSFETLNNDAPWLTTVAAGTIDREFNGTLTLGNGVSISGFTFYLGNNTANVPIVFMGLCDNVDELIKVKSKIVVCEDKNGTLADQVSNVYKAEVVGVVFISNSPGAVYCPSSDMPSIFINRINGETVKAYIKSNSDSSKASMFFKITTFGARPAPSVDDYSSRGPSTTIPFVLKPDITAPGTKILAAWPPNIPVDDSLDSDTDLYNKFNFLTGTSMASPHVAGVGALLRGAHSDWSPAAIRSAIVTTSDIFDNTMGFIKDIGKGYKTASPLAMGAGHVNPNRALDPGLVYDAQVQDYVNLLCAMNFTQKNIAAITRSSSYNCSNPLLDLNYPSFIAFFNEKNNSSGIIQEFQRTVTNVGEGDTTYVASVTPINGFHISVIPNKLVFKGKNEKLSYKLMIKGAKVTKEINEVNFGYLTWTDVQHVVRSPVVITTLKFKS